GALEKELGHPGIVVVRRGNVTVAALPGFFRANRVRDESAEGLAGEAFGGNGLLRVIEPLAIGVLRTYEDGAGRARGRDAMAGDGAIHAEEIGVVAQDLKVVASVISGEQAFVVEHRSARVGRHLQVAAETGWRPGRM